MGGFNMFMGGQSNGFGSPPTSGGLSGWQNWGQQQVGGGVNPFNPGLWNGDAGRPAGQSQPPFMQPSQVMSPFSFDSKMGGNAPPAPNLPLGGGLNGQGDTQPFMSPQSNMGIFGSPNQGNFGGPSSMPFMSPGFGGWGGQFNQGLTGGWGGSVAPNAPNLPLGGGLNGQGDAMFGGQQQWGQQSPWAQSGGWSNPQLAPFIQYLHRLMGGGF